MVGGITTRKRAGEGIEEEKVRKARAERGPADGSLRMRAPGRDESVLGYHSNHVMRVIAYYNGAGASSESLNFKATPPPREVLSEVHKD